MSKLKNVFDNYYSKGYREELITYEFARYAAIDHFIHKILNLQNVNKVLDYGCGSGLHIPLWKKLFPGTDLYFCDISDIAIEKLTYKYPQFKQTSGIVRNHVAPFKDGSFDVIISIEVLEHVENLDMYLQDIHRLLKRNGIIIWTTPCANIFSIEHLYSFFSHQIEKTKEGYRKWKWEDPKHFRRFRSNELKDRLLDKGFRNIRFKFRAHFFSFICANFFQSFLRKIGEKIMLLDYKLFRNFPNGASMIGCAYNI